MDLEQAFLADIVAHPTDPTPWLVLADWLEERDDPRGEVVRLMRQLWDEPKHREFKARRARLEELFLAGLRPPWPRMVDPLGIEFVWIPPGHFWMGGQEGRPGKQRVRIAEAFWLAVYPVTQAQWRAVMGDNPCYFSRAGEGADRVAKISDADLDRFPVEWISWNDTKGFLHALNERHPADGWRYSLPTSEQWEYACRGPVFCRADCGHSYYFDRPTNTLTPELANFEHSLRRPSKVGSYPPNRLGLYDLHGNVWEWLTIPGGVRGGGWSRDKTCCLARYCIRFTLDYRTGNAGCRLARVAVR